MKSVLPLLLALASLASAQFSQFAITDDGSQVFFVSRLLLKGNTGASEWRLYRLSPGGLSVFAERESQSVPYFRSNSDGISGPFVSGDAGVIGFTIHDICSGDPCTVIQSDAMVRGAVNRDLGSGTLQLSRNGRWALITQGGVVNLTTGQIETPNPVLVDLTTGARTETPPLPIGITNFALASDGTVLVRPENALPALWKAGVTRPLQLPAGGVGLVGLSDDASTLIYSAVTLVRYSLIARDLNSGKESTLYTATNNGNPPAPVVVMGISNDGKRVLYRVMASGTMGPPYLADTSTGASTMIALPNGEFASDGALSGSGAVAVIVTSAGSLLRVTDKVETLIPATPYLSSDNPLAVGSYTRLHGAFGESVAFQRPKLLLNGQLLTVFSYRGDEVDVQIPWEAKTGTGAITFADPSSTPFETTVDVNVSPQYPLPEFADPGVSWLGLKMATGDFSGYVTSQPAPGDIINLYTTGLGAVQTPVATLQPASLTTPDPILGTFTCQFNFNQRASTLETLFAGLAPGFLGFYQVTLRVPADAGTDRITGFGCQLVSPFGSGGFGLFFAQLPAPNGLITPRGLAK